MLIYQALGDAFRFFFAVCQGRHGSGIIGVAEADLRCGTVVEAAQCFARDKSCFYFDSQREIEKPLAVLNFQPCSMTHHDTSHVVKPRRFVQHCATILW